VADDSAAFRNDRGMILAADAGYEVLSESSTAKESHAQGKQGDQGKNAFHNTNSISK
jgi:hypothetical protein